MNAPLTYPPAYLGLFAALLLGVACNAFLDIGYGSFGVEIGFWALVFAWTVRVGWRQHGQPDDSGPGQQKAVLLLGLVACVLVFLPMWGLPRAGIYLLAVLQAAQNCVTTSRRQLHLGLLVSAVMVIFAASHYRADWTMLFYLIPYIVAVVFTLVSEQISRRAGAIRAGSLGDAGRAGQGIAIAAATAIILGIGGLLYLATPQPTWPYLEWRYGQLSNLGWVGETQAQGPSGRTEQGGEGQAGDGPGGGVLGSASAGDGAPAGGGGGLSPGRGWPTPAEMREAAGRPGMPEWQAGAIRRLADLDEAIGEALAPLKSALDDLWQRLRDWLKEHRTAALLGTFALLLLALALIVALLLREARAAIWLRTRYDYLRLVVFARHATGSAGAAQFYRAMERLFAVRDTPRAATANPREYLREATCCRDDLRPEAAELTRLFEEYRYGPALPDGARLARMRAAYRALFGKLA